MFRFIFKALTEGAKHVMQCNPKKWYVDNQVDISCFSTVNVPIEFLTK